MAEPHVNPHHARRWLILGVIAVAQLMVVLDATIVNIALPSAQDALGFSDGASQWIVTSYALAFGSLLLLGGRIGDLFGRKRVFVVGLLGFAGASVLGGLAENFTVLVAARALQGVFGALLAPGALSLLTTTFTEPGERAKAFGVFGAVAVGGAAIGLLLGGILTEYLSWRWCLYVNLLIAIPAALAAQALLHNEVPATKAKLDLPGTVTASTGLFAIVYGFSNAHTDSWTAPLTLTMLVAGVLLLVAFVAIQQRSSSPLLPLRVVLDRDRGGSFLAMVLAGAGMFAVFLFLTFYLQNTLGFSPIKTGLAFLPMTGTIIIAATSATVKLLPKVGPRPLIGVGMVTAAVGLVSLTAVGVDTAYASHVLPGLLIMGAGMGLVFSSAMATATFGVDPQDAGVASAMVNTMQQVGGSIGTALLSTIAASATTGALAGQAPSQELVSAAAVHGYTTAFWWAAAIFATGAVLCTALLSSRSREVAAPGAEPVFAHS
jgi:EmrB/QacA subfamily drug resistance transporter